jgi:hypothetical protein
MAVWYSLSSFGIFFPILACLDQEKSGNPALSPKNETPSEKKIEEKKKKRHFFRW